MRMRRALTALLALLTSGALTPSAISAEWKAGTGRAVITPTTPMWMTGYASRDRPAEGKLHELWAKALALEDASGKRVVLITLDVCGIDRSVSIRIRDRLGAEFQLNRESIAIACSHTHSGPMLGDYLPAMKLLDAAQQGHLDQYTRELEEKVFSITGAAFKSLAPARLAWTLGKATFAVNRRNNPEAQVPALREKGELRGPVDHDLPVMTVTGTDRKLIAIMYGYACHATTTNLYEWSGDWPGVASMEIEKAHPGTTALCWIGCGGDQNPLPRRSYELLQNYGNQAAAGVKAAIEQGPLKPIEPKLAAAYSEIDLPFATLPTKQTLGADLTSKDKFVANRARILLGKLERDGGLSPHYPYPIQLWRLGVDLKWIQLGGEVTVEYSLRLKKELGPGDTWVGAYMNDVMAYIPSLKVLNEGGYEGEQSMVYYAQPAKWAPQVEEMIVKEVRHQVEGTSK